LSILPIYLTGVWKVTFSNVRRESFSVGLKVGKCPSKMSKKNPGSPLKILFMCQE
jgi:hypothetical protein